MSDAAGVNDQSRDSGLLEPQGLEDQVRAKFIELIGASEGLSEPSKVIIRTSFASGSSPRRQELVDAMLVELRGARGPS